MLAPPLPRVGTPLLRGIMDPSLAYAHVQISYVYILCINNKTNLFVHSYTYKLNDGYQQQKKQTNCWIFFNWSWQAVDIFITFV